MKVSIFLRQLFLLLFVLTVPSISRCEAGDRVGYVYNDEYDRLAPMRWTSGFTGLACVCGAADAVLSGAGINDKLWAGGGPLIASTAFSAASIVLRVLGDSQRQKSFELAPLRYIYTQLNNTVPAAINRENYRKIIFSLVGERTGLWCGAWNKVKGMFTRGGEVTLFNRVVRYKVLSAVLMLLFGADMVISTVGLLSPHLEHDIEIVSTTLAGVGFMGTLLMLVGGYLERNVQVHNGDLTDVVWPPEGESNLLNRVQ